MLQQQLTCNPITFEQEPGGEIDLVLEGSFGLLPIEVKYQSNTRKKTINSNEQLYRSA